MQSEYAQPFGIRGTLELVSNGVDISGVSDCKAFVYSWLDAGRDHSARVDMAPGCQAPAGGRGEFTIEHVLKRKETTDVLKLQVCLHTQDPESGNFRTITYCTGVAPLAPLLRGETFSTILADQFEDKNQAVLSLTGGRAVQGVELGRSALHDTARCNAIVDRLSKQMGEAMRAHQIRMPPGGDMFVDGRSSWEMGGGSLGQDVLPPVMTHYSLMSLHEELLERDIPIALCVYSLNLRLNHSGLSPEELLALPDEEFAPLFLGGLGLTYDAGLVPYQRDFTLSLAFSFLSGLCVTCKSTENMALPLGAPQFQGRALGQPVARVSARPDTHLGAPMDALQRAVQNQPDRQPAALLDDCESSAELGHLMAMSVRRAFPATGSAPDRLAQHLSGWHLFEDWKRPDIELMAGIVQRGANMLNAGGLELHTVTGIAKSAALGGDEDASYNGHCHNLGLLHRSDGTPFTFLLEGTSPMRQMHLSDRVQTMIVRLRAGPTGDLETRPLDMAAFLTTIGGAFASLTQVINAPNGGRGQEGGWALSPPVSGWIASGMVLPSLQSDRRNELRFYNRVMYAGLQCSACGVGCMPVEEGAAGRVGGCHPYDLDRMDLRGLSATLADDERELFRRVLNEAMPPLVPTSTLKELSHRWVPCLPLSYLNRMDLKRHGARYHVASFMETPSHLDAVPAIYEAKAALIKEMNRINLARPGSDGIFGDVRCLGSGVHGLLFVEDRPGAGPCNVTVVTSLLEAMQKVGWPNLDKLKSQLMP